MREALPIIGHQRQRLDGRATPPGGDNMKRSLWAVLGVVAVALAVPAMALAHHHSFNHGHHHGPSLPAGATATVASYDQGVLTLNLSGGGTLTGNVSFHTHFVCLGSSSYWRRFERHRRAIRGHAADVGSTGPSGPSGSSGSTGPTGTSGSTGTSGTGGNGHRHTPPTGSTGTTGFSGGHGHDRSPGFGRGSQGYGNGHSHSYTPPPPCDSSLLVSGATLQSAGVLLVPGGVQFASIVLLPAVQ
jgi:hypothetical protein